MSEMRTKKTLKGKPVSRHSSTLFDVLITPSGSEVALELQKITFIQMRRMHA
jgi:hypothetical protein